MTRANAKVVKKAAALALWVRARDMSLSPSRNLYILQEEPVGQSFAQKLEKKEFVKATTVNFTL